MSTDCTWLASDEHYMRQALELADAAAAIGEVPVGAVVVYQQRVIGAGHNRQIVDRDPSAHAEVIALRSAGADLDNYRLTDAVLYSTIEPCTMCLGASVHARISHIVFGAPEPRAGASALLSADAEPGKRFNHVPTIAGGCLARECGSRLVDFFKARRGSSTEGEASRES